MKNINRLMFILIIVSGSISAQPWEEDISIFNPSGVPSYSFSQPRFHDLDSDGDFDMILGNLTTRPIYFENVGSKSEPSWERNDLLFKDVSSIDSEMGVCADLDGDGDLDFIGGGYTGLHFYENIGKQSTPKFELKEDFFKNIVVGSNPVPTFGDLDFDGDADLILGYSEDGGVKYFPNTGTPTSAEFLQANAVSLYDVGLYAYPVLFDYDGDNDLDLLVGRDGHGFKFYNNIGDSSAYQFSEKSYLFNSLGQGSYWNSPDLLDLNDDGKPEIVFGTAKGIIHYYTNSQSVNTPSWKLSTSAFGETIDIGSESKPDFIDFDGDGDLDLLSGSQLGDIKYIENTGTASKPAWKEKSSVFSSIDHSIYSAVTAGDIDNDSIPEIVVGDLSGNLYLHKKSGSTYVQIIDSLSNFSFGGFTVPKFFDYDKDNDLDLIVGSESGKIYMIENTGSIDSAKWKLNDSVFSSIDVGRNATPTLFDIDDDGDFDLLSGTLSGELKFYENSEQGFVENSTGFDLFTRDQGSAPVAVDLDADGDLDIVVGDHEGTFTFYRNMKIVGVENEVVERPNNYSLFQNYPNPFNPSTTISYGLQKPGYIKIAVYNSIGEMVKILIDEYQSAGNHSIDFNAENLSSGIYFYQLNVNGFTSIKKMVLLK